MSWVPSVLMFLFVKQGHICQEFLYHILLSTAADSLSVYQSSLTPTSHLGAGPSWTHAQLLFMSYLSVMTAGHLLNSCVHTLLYIHGSEVAN